MKRKTKTKALSLLLSLVLVLSLVPSLGLTAYAANAYSGGTGTQADPYLISKVDDWKALATAVNDGTDYSGKYFKQTADLNMSGVEGLVPAGTMEAPFAGNYNGSGFEISNAAINVVVTSHTAIAGIFGVITGKGSVSNLKVKGASVTATTGTGGWDQAYGGGLVALAEDCTITNCSVSNSTITASGSNNFAGAFVGFAGAENSEKTTFSKCASENNTVNTMVYGGGFIGAIVNETSSDDTISFTDCYSAKNSTDAGTHNYGTVGAFIGGSQGGNVTAQNCFVYDCNSTATGAGAFKGIFAGDITYGTVKATNCYYYDTHELTVNAESAISKTADEMKSLASALGDTFTDGELYPVFGHKHSFTYSANGATITATCSEANCDLTDSKVTLTIGDPANIYANDNSSSHEFTLEGLDDFNSATGLQVSADDIVYYKGDNITNQIRENDVRSSTTYRARLTVNGVRAEHSFKYSIKLAPHTHKFTYTAEGNVITATCTQSDPAMENCDLTDKKATLTLNAPAHQTYGDGLDVNATLTGSIPGKDNPTINYKKSDTPLSSAPTDAGSYTAWCQLGNATARKNYTIAQATASYSTEPTAKTGLVYTGEALELVNDGTVNGGDIAYTAGTDPDNEPDVTAGGMPYSYAVPKMTDVGTYYVWYKLEGGKNYTSIAAKRIEVTIAKADITPTVSLEGWTYGEDAKTPNVTGNRGKGDVTYSYKVKDADDSTYTSTVPTNAGDYIVKATIAESGKYNGGEATKNFTIAKKAATITVEAKSKTYGDVDPTLTATVDGTVGGDTLNYTLSRTEGNNFGEYDITVNLGENPNYEITAIGAKFTIDKKAVTITAKNQSIYVSGTVPTLEGEDFYTVTGLMGEDKLTTNPTLVYQKDGSETIPDTSAVGTYDIVPGGASAGDNYTITYENGTLTINRRSSGGGGGGATVYAITPAKADNGSVSTSPTNATSGKTVTVTVKPDEGYKLDKLTVTDKNGKEIAVTEKDGKYTFTMPAGKVNVTPVFVKDDSEPTTPPTDPTTPPTDPTTPPADNENPFVDVKADDYFYDAVLWAAKENITSGTTDTTFSPNESCTRGQTVTFLWREAGSPEPTTNVNPFTDVKTGDYFYKAVLWAYENGITQGTSDTEFSPNATVTRGQTVTFLYRSTGEKTNGNNSFTDVKTGDYYYDSVLWAYENEITSGTSDTTFSPNDNCLRGQIVTFLYRCNK